MTEPTHRTTSVSIRLLFEWKRRRPAERDIGIRYATARRFDHAQLSETPLEGVQDVSEYGQICPQHMVVPSGFAPDIGLPVRIGNIVATCRTRPDECVAGTSD